MEADTDSKLVSFCALPYIDSTKGAFSIADFEIWPNTSSNWISHFGVDLSNIMTQYRDKKDIPVANKASIITHKDRSKLVDREEFRAVVICLAAADWILNEEFRVDEWIFETWDINPKQDLNNIIYDRLAKYSLQFNSHEYDRLFPNPYMSTPRSFSLAGYPAGSEGHRVVTFLEHQLTCDPKKSLVGVLHRFHKARFDTPYYNTIGDDLDSLWSGFELLWNLSRPEPTTAEPPSGGLHRCLLKITQSRLFRAVFAIAKSKKSRSKSQLLADFILSELEEELQSRLIERDSFEAGLRIWADALYLKRNLHSHGNPLPVKDDILPYYKRSILFTGLLIARGVLFLKIHKGAFSEDKMALALFYHHYRNNDALPLLFIEHPDIAETVKFVNGVEDTNDWFNSGTIEEKGKEKHDFVKFTETLKNFSRIDKITRGYRGDKQLLNAATKLALVLSKYSTNSTNKNVITDKGIDLATIAPLITAILAKQNKAGMKKDRATIAMLEEIAEYCDRHLLQRSYNYNIQKMQKSDLLIRPGIEIWLWVAAFVRMVKMYRGY